MFELIISACMVTNPATCKDVHLTYLKEIASPYQCMRVGQPEMAKWSISNPKWAIRKWRCGRVNVSHKEI